MREDWRGSNDRATETIRKQTRDNPTKNNIGHDPPGVVTITQRRLYRTSTE